MILIPKYRDIIVPVQTRPGVRGWYKIEALQPDGRKRLLADWFPNLITTLGADLLGTDTPLTFCAVGSGNRAPALTDTTLQTLVASTSTHGPAGVVQSAQSSAPFFGSTTTQYSFAAGTATGNLSEVGVGSAAGSLFSRALILDGTGTPTTLTVLANEALFVTYQLNQYVPTADVTGNVTIAGVVYAYTLRASLASSIQWAYTNGDRGGLLNAVVFSGPIGAVTGQPSGTNATDDSINNNAYVAGSSTLSGTATWGINSGNVGGVAAVTARFGSNVGSRGVYQVGFTPSIPKDSSHVLTLSFSTSWVINSP